MDQKHKDIIRDNYVDLVEDLKGSVNQVCAFLYQSRIISARMKEDILESNKTASHKAEAVLDLIVRRGPSAFETLYMSFLDAELYPAADILKPIKAPHLNLAANIPVSSTLSDGLPENTTQADAPRRETSQVQESSITFGTLEIDLPESWPSKDHIKKEKIKVQHVTPESQMYKDYFYSLKPLGQTLYYTMQHIVRGRVLIINNESFIRGVENAGLHFLRDRVGSSLDRDSLKILFQQLGFEVKIHDNQTEAAMNKILKEECKQDHSNFDCFIMIILSHGHKGIVYGTDGYYVDKQGTLTPYNCIKVKDIKSQICSISSLRGKPKLFFIQACRGRKTDPGVLYESSEMEAAALETGDRDMDMNIQDVNVTLRELENAEQSDGPDTIPSDADYFMAMSTVSDMVSWRNEELGSWFIQAIVYIFWNYAHVWDLNRLMTLVNSLVSRAKTTHHMKQVAEKRDTLRKTFCFFPGLHPGLQPRVQS